ncbi:MAG: hypothetical protein EBR82_11850 [Caulobacteraceae bacterium]|nr:hypothetical protein [Caulobacteraceae bacterium]
MSADNNRAIMVQVAGKIAGEMVASMQLRNTEEVMNSFNEVFSRVLIAMDTTVSSNNTRTTKGGRSIPVISQDEIKLRLNQTLQAGTAVTSNLVQF